MEGRGGVLEDSRVPRAAPLRLKAGDSRNAVEDDAFGHANAKTSLDALEKNVGAGRPETPRPRASPFPVRRAALYADRPGIRTSRLRRGARRRVPDRRLGAAVWGAGDTSL